MKRKIAKTISVMLIVVMVFSVSITAFALADEYYWDNANNGFPLIKRGALGTYVRVIQRVLNDSGYTLSEDGNFGSATEGRVKEFQRNQSITDDGKVGRVTWGRLQNQTYLVASYSVAGQWLEYRGVHSYSDVDFYYQEYYGTYTGAWYFMPGAIAL